jgi:hypothetical protein
MEVWKMTIEGANAAGTADLSSGDATSTTSSIIPGDNYASGGPEPQENRSEDAVDLGEFDFEKAEKPASEEPETPEPAEEKPPEVPEPVKREQSPEANAAFAEMRRKAEEAERALKERDSWVAQNFGQSHGIHTWEQYQSAVAQTHQRQQIARQQEMQQRPAIVFQSTYDMLVNQGYEEPVAREIANAKAATADQSLRLEAVQSEIAAIRRQEQANQEAFRQQQMLQQQEAIHQQKAREILTDYDKLRKDYGDLVPTNLAKLGDETVEKLKKGYSLYDAWFITNKTKVLEKAQKAEAQKTLNKINSKSHLKTEGDGAGDSNASATPLPADTLQMYKDSGMTERQARAFHKKLYG